MLLDNNAYSSYTPEELKQRVFIGKSVINLILLVSLVSSMGFWYVLGLDASTSTGFLAVISFSIIGLGLASEIVKKVTLSLFRNKTIWLSATFVSVLTVAGMLSILDNNKELNLLHNSDSYLEAQAQQKTAFNDAKKWAWASGYNLDVLNNKLIELTAKRERREISYQPYLAEKRVIQDKINGVKQYQSALNTQFLASKLMANNSNSATSTNPLLSNIATQTGATFAILKMVFYLFVTVFLEYAAWFLGGEVEKIENYVRSSKKERLEQMNVATFGASYEDITQPKNEPTALLSNIENTYFMLVNGKKKGGEKTAISAQAFINSLTSHLEQSNLLEKYAGVEFKAVNKDDSTDFAVYKVDRPTLKNQPKNNPLEPQKIEPKQVQNPENLEPKQVQEVQGSQVQNTTKPDTAGEGVGSQVQVHRIKRFKSIGSQVQEIKEVHKTGSTISKANLTGSKRQKETPDTGTTGETSHRYNSIKKAIEEGAIKPTLRAIKSFKVDGIGVGDATAQRFRKALIRDDVIKVK